MNVEHFFLLCVNYLADICERAIFFVLIFKNTFVKPPPFNPITLTAYYQCSNFYSRLDFEILI